MHWCDFFNFVTERFLRLRENLDFFDIRAGARRKGARTPQFFRSGAGAAGVCCEKVGFTSVFRVQIRVRVSRASGPAILSRK